MQDDEKDLSNATDGSDAPSEPDAPASEAVAPAGRRRRLWPWVLLTLALMALAVALLFDWNWFKGIVENRVSAATGRPFHIDGNLDVRLSKAPLVTMDRVRLDSPAGMHPGTMATADKVRFRVEAWPLLHGDTIFPEVLLVHPVAHFERRPDGLDNWEFPPSTSSPIVRRFTIENGLLTYREDAQHTNLVVSIASDTSAKTSRLAPLLFHGNGTYRNNPFTLQGRADSPLELRDTKTPYQIDMTATAGPTRARASGALRNPLQATGFDLDFELSGPDLGLLYHLMGVVTPETPPYRIRGRLGHVGHTWTYRQFKGTVGSSDLAGDVTVDNRGLRRFMKAELTSRRLDVHDLAGFVGAPAHANPARAATPKQQAEAIQAQASERILPTQTFDLERLRSMDTDVTLRARAVSGTPVPLSDFSTRFVLLNGTVYLDPFDFGAAGGKLRSKITMDASKPVITTSAKVTARGIDFAKLVPNVPAIQRSAGTIGANIDLRGTGNSVAKMFATSNGRASAGMGGGKVSDMLMAYAALNIARILRLKISGDRDEPIRCVVGDFIAKDGIWTANRLVFDSEDTVISGTGDIDLRDETLSLVLKVKPKHNSLLSLRAPLHVEGSLRHPDIRPDYKVIGLRGAAIVVLGSIALPAAELGLIDLGRGKNSECMKGDEASKSPTKS